MLDDSRMDKKSLNRSSQTQSRASAVDCKKNSDLTCKPWPRNNKKRESTSNAPKNDISRKNVASSRGRGQVDRRPRARGNNGFVTGGASDTGLVVEDEAEYGSVLVNGSKKQNLNHLLNFMYSPRGGPGQSGGLTPARRYNLHTFVRKHNQDLYLQASCQFVVKEGGDYSLNLSNPDELIDWNQIEEIVLHGNGKAECPICLCSAVAARVGRCGHALCWPCALHYAAVHAQSPPPCPVCLAPLPVARMKPARTFLWDPSDEEVCFRLVRRLRGSTVVEVAPVRGLVSPPAPMTLPFDNIAGAPYCKLFTASSEQVQNILERERKELKDQILAEIDTTEIVYIEEALEVLRVQEERNKNCPSAYNITTKKNETEAVPIVYEKQMVNQSKKIDWFDVDEQDVFNTSKDDSTASNVDENDEDIQSVTEKLDKCQLNPDAAEFVVTDVVDFDYEEFPLTEDLPSENSVEIVEQNELTEIDIENQSKYFYFYQAADGQNIFLNSINVRMMRAAWGALLAAPPVLKGRILHRDTHSLTDQTRKHMPCAAHLPLHCPIEIVEVELKPPYVTQQVLKDFYDELKRRARARARLEQQERKRERAYRRQMEGPPKPDFMSEVQFPLPSPPAYTSPLFVEPVPLNREEQSPNSSASASGLSFAKMASTSGTWRVRPTPAPRAPTPPPSPTTAPRALSLSDAIEAALQAPTSKKSRNKKNKHKIQFNKLERY